METTGKPELVDLIMKEWQTMTTRAERRVPVNGLGFRVSGSFNWPINAKEMLIKVKYGMREYAEEKFLDLSPRDVQGDLLKKFSPDIVGMD